MALNRLNGSGIAVFQPSLDSCMTVTVLTWPERILSDHTDSETVDSKVPIELRSPLSKRIAAIVYAVAGMKMK